ncbi:hypothetical protein [Streptomyces rishiriensis]|uniref:hypothetical protein n=1 Tax=Streptomyces rishiriensis TaxID=68264 RepID=UPI000D58EF55|nr:hypothetical protein [Streptomyces rishiriensis]
MTLGELLPVRLGHFARTPRTRHRAIDEVDRQKGLRAGADILIMGLRVQLDDAEAVRAWTAAQLAEAEELVVKLQADVDDLTAERDCLDEEVAALKARFAAQLAAEANAHRIAVPCGYRDTSALEDQATRPIDVKTLWDALGIQPVTDPGRIH